MDVEIEYEDGQRHVVSGVKAIRGGWAKNTVPQRPLKVGDIVRQNGNIGFGYTKKLARAEGVIILIDRYFLIGVVFPNIVGLDNLHTLTRAFGDNPISAARGRWYTADELELIED